jgi:hypothetical protein
MTQPVLPPRTEELIDEDKFATLNWTAFFESVAAGDAGSTWTPTFTGLTEVGGAATITGAYYRLSAKLVFIKIVITPVTNTSATLGTTFCNNFPLTIRGSNAVTTVSGFTASTAGANSTGIYAATWSAITTAVTLTGIIEAN